MSFSVFPSEIELKQAINALRQGKVVAYPTETFYGLAVDPDNSQAISSLYALKKRDPSSPLSLLVPGLDVLATTVGSVPVLYEALINMFWPGPLTLIFPSHANTSPLLTGSGNTLAIRISSHPVARHLCELWGRPLTATSANISGEPALTTADGVRSLWGGDVECVLDGGETPGGKGSTIIRCVEGEQKCYIVREGVIPLQALSNALPSNYIICKA